MSDDFKVQATVNAPPPAQYAKGAMINFRGDTVSEVQGELQAAIQLGLFELVAQAEGQLSAATDGGLGAKTVEVVPSDAPPWAQPQNVQSQQQHVAPVANLRVCLHGARTMKNGTSAKGAWTGYFCPLGKKAGACDPEWA